MIKDYNKVKSDQLGHRYQALMVHLRRQLLFKYVKACGENICFRCRKEIIDDANFSIDHKIPWMYSKEPLTLFSDLDNIAFSHKKCNYNTRRQNFSRFGKSGYKGVVEVQKKKGPNKFQALLSKDRKQRYLGQFDTAEEAAKAYDIASVETYGDNAVTNAGLGLL